STLTIARVHTHWRVVPSTGARLPVFFGTNVTRVCSCSLSMVVRSLVFGITNRSLLPGGNDEKSTGSQTTSNRNDESRPCHSERHAGNSRYSEAVYNSRRGA